MKNRDIVPILLSLVLLSGLGILAYLRHHQGIGAWAGYAIDPDLVFVGAYVLWIVVESRIARKDLHTEGTHTPDFGTCQVYAVGQAATILTALWLPSRWQTPSIAHLIGAILFAGGVLYRLWAIRTLGQYYSHRVRAVEQHRIVDTGPYRFIRHPAYVGMLVAHAGVTTYFCNWVTVGAFLLILVPAIVLRIKVEERMLFEIEGYADFAQHRKRLIPRLW